MHLLLAFMLVASPPPSGRAVAPACGGVTACSSLEEFVAWAMYAPADSVWLDLRYVAATDEAERWFRAGSPDERREFLHAFWAVRAARSIITPDSRYQEHRRRLEKARRWYGKASSRRMVGATGSMEWYEVLERSLRPSSRSTDLYRVDLDDRGLMFMRFGEPARILGCVASSKSLVEKGYAATTYDMSERGEIWIYPPLMLGGPRVMMFATRGRANAYQLVFTPGQTECETRDVIDLIRSLAPVSSDFVHAAAEDLLGARGFIGAVSYAMEQGNLGAGKLMSEVAVLDANLSAQIAAASSELAAPRYEASLTAAYGLLYFLDLSEPGSRRTEVHLTAASPAVELLAADAGEYRYRARLTLIDSVHAITEADSSLVYQPARRLPAGAAIEHGLSVAVSPGVYSYGLRLEGGDAVDGPVAGADDSPTDSPRRIGRGSPVAGKIRVPALYPEHDLRISSIAIGRPNLMGSWARLGESMDLIPTHVVPTDGRVAFYYEVYGAPAGERLETTLILARRGSRLMGGNDSMRLKFEAVGEGSQRITPAIREVDMSSLAAGDYDILLSVSSATRGETTVETLLRWR